MPVWRNNCLAREIQWACLLWLSIGLLGCSAGSPPEPPGCRVELGGPVEPQPRGVPPTPDALAQTGPHHFWSTQPHPSCNANPRIQAASSDTELELLITYPAATNPLESGYGDVAPGKWPVILFAHANTYADCHLVDAYTTLHQRWASWGFIVVSVDASALCVKNSKANLEGRRDDLVAAWSSVAQMGQQPEHILYGHIDTEKVVLAGHSRGATAALLAVQEIQSVDGLIWLQGVDTGGYQLGRPPVTVPTLGIVAGLDRDIRFPRAEPTRDQLTGPHAWTTLLGGIHAFSSDRIPARKKDTPGLERNEQLEISAHLSTLLLAAAVGVSDGVTVAELPGAQSRMFGPDLQGLHPGIRGTWQRAAHRITWIENFQLEASTAASNATPPELPGNSAHRTLSWKPGETDGGKILGDSYALKMDAGNQAAFSVCPDPCLTGLTLAQGTVLAFLMKDLETGPMHVRVETNAGETISVGSVAPTPDIDPSRFSQVEIELAPDAAITLKQVVLELGAGHVIVDDIRFVAP